MAEYLEDDYTVEDEAITGVCFEFKLNVYDTFQLYAMFTVDIVKWYNAKFTQSKYAIVTIRDHDVEIFKNVIYN